LVVNQEKSRLTTLTEGFPFLPFEFRKAPARTMCMMHCGSMPTVPDLPGVIAYYATEEEALRKVKSIALQVLADKIETGEEGPALLKVLFAA
jgi:hypothetical protein